MRRRVLVRVPASTSNLGPGFDAVGSAVDRWLTVSVTLGEPGSGSASVERAGTLAALTIDAEEDRLLIGFRAACSAAARPTAGVPRVRASSTIPIARGLGSSAAATVAGAAAANALLRLGLGDVAIADICARVEGHPDNVVPAMHGGTTLALRTGNGALTVTPLRIHGSLGLVLAVPDFTVETTHARRALPRELPHAAAARAAALGAALVHGLATADARLLAAALDDVLHVPFRRALVPGYDAVTRAAVRAGAIGATLSGSGSAIVAIAPLATAVAVGEAMTSAWHELGIGAEWFSNPPEVGGHTVAVRNDGDDAIAPAHESPGHTAVTRG